MAFDAVGELAGQPGGQELGALVARVQHVDPEVLRGMGRRLGSLIDGVAAAMRALEGHTEDVRNAWQGRGADAATGYLEEFGRAGTRTVSATARIRAEIDGAGEMLAGMRREVDAAVSRALDAARRARTEALADPARAPMADQLAAQAMAEPTTSARAAVERAETALAYAARVLRGLAGDVTAFSRLPVPDARTPGWSPAGESFPAESFPAGPAVTDPTDRLSAATGDSGTGGSGAGAASSGGWPLDSEGSVVTSTDGTGTGSTGAESTGAESTGADADGAGSDPGGSEPGGSGSTDGDPAGGNASPGDADTGGADPDAADDAEADEAGGETGAVVDASGDGSDGSGDAPVPSGGPKGQVGDWIREAMGVLQAQGVPLDKMNPDDIATIIDHESGGDPNATNDWDSNAAKGTPSQGLMQTIAPTFDAYKLACHGTITDPVDNIIAGVRYAIDRYGSVSQVPGVEAVARGDAYVGY